MEEALKPADDENKWTEIVKAWRESGLSKAEFCKKKKIVVSAFYYWCRKIDGCVPRKPVKKAPTKSSVKEKPAFVEITIPKVEGPANAATQVFRITTSYGAVMEIPL